MIEIVLLDNISGQVNGYITEIVKNEIISNCSFQVQGSFFSPRCQKGAWNGFRKLFSETTQKFPLGLFSLVTEIFKKYKVPYTILDNRIKPKYTIKDFKIPNITFRPYQIDAIKKSLQAGRGIIQIATGGGKSLIIAAIVQALKDDLRINIFVHRTTLLRQLEVDLKRAGITPGIIGDKERQISNINICSFQSILKKTQVSKTIRRFTAENLYILGQADVILVDEVHHISSEFFYEVHKLSTKAYFRYGFSATPWREDGCFSAKTRILLGDGTTESIGHIVKNKLPFSIMGYDIKNKKIVKSKILKYQKKITKQKLFKITFKSYGIKKCVCCTPEHLIYTENRGWIKAKNLTYTDTIIMYKRDIWNKNKVGVYSSSKKGKTMNEFYGRKKAEKIKNKISIKVKETSPIKGKTYEEFYGKLKAKELRKKISRPGRLNANYGGKSVTEISRYRNSVAIRGKKNSRYVDGNTITKYTKLTRNYKMDAWKKKIKERDNYICQDCNKLKLKKQDCHAHHICSVLKYPNKRYHLTNGITLCSSCHHKRHWKQIDI